MKILNNIFEIQMVFLFIGNSLVAQEKKIKKI